jgi:hypothetical protein
VSTRPLVYIASPYTLGDQAINARFQCETFDRLMNEFKVFPYAPLWNHYQHSIFPRQAQDWVDHDNAVLVRCDAVLRLDVYYEGEVQAGGGMFTYFQQESSGSDAEVALAVSRGIPVFYNVADLYKWVAMYTGGGAR